MSAGWRDADKEARVCDFSRDPAAASAADAAAQARGERQTHAIQ